MNSLVSLQRSSCAADVMPPGLWQSVKLLQPWSKIFDWMLPKLAEAPKQAACSEQSQPDPNKASRRAKRTEALQHGPSKRQALRVLLWVFALGCGSDPAPPPTFECGGLVDCSIVRQEAPSVEVGQGDPFSPTFEPLGEDAHILLESGPQGGYHVYLSVRAHGLCPTRVTLDRALRMAGDPLVHRRQRSFSRLVDDEEGAWILGHSPRTFICPATYSGYPMHGVPLEVDFTVSEDASCVEDGGAPRSATGTVRFTADCPPGDEICLGDDVVGCDVWNGS